MAIITLTTDLGTKDFYVGLVKAELLKGSRDVVIVDISHEVEPFNILQAAFIFKNCYKDFPEETIHIIGMDSGGQTNMKYLVVRENNMYFIGPDNGIFSLIFEKKPDEVFALNYTNGQSNTFPVKDIFTKAACHLANGGDVSAIGEHIDSIVEKTLIQPVISENLIQGNVIYIDSFKNIIVNIDKKLFDRVGQGRRFKIHYHKKESIDTLSHSYDDVPEGEAVSLFGISGYLEIALNRAPAQSLLGIQINEQIQIEFL